MTEVEVTTQEQLDQATEAGHVAIVRSGYFEASGSGQVTAYGSSQVTAYGSSQVTAYGSSQVRAYGSSQVTAYDSSQVTASGSSQVTAYGSSQVTAYGSSQVTAYGSSQVRAYGSSQVRAYGSGQVTAYDSSQVTAYGSSQVRAYDSSQVTASGSSQVRAYDSSQVTATRAVAVTVHGDLAMVTGGVRIDAPTLDSVEAWLDNYGIEPVDGIVTLFKAVRSGFRSSHGFAYVPGSVPVAPDWDGGVSECGGGLHFSPFPWMAQAFDLEASVFVGCPVAVSDIRTPGPGDSYPEKVKARGCCGPVFLVDIDGNPIVKEET